MKRTAFAGVLVACLSPSVLGQGVAPSDRLLEPLLIVADSVSPGPLDYRVLDEPKQLVVHIRLSKV